MTPQAGTAIIGRLLEREREDIAPEAARYFLRMDFRKEDHARVEQLSAKAKKGTLSTDEQDELDTYLFVADFVALLQSKARQALKRCGHPS